MIVVIAGHYGVGKTNLALNMAFDYKQLGWDVALADVDVVNPYFRSSDYREQLEAAGVRVIAPLFAGTTLDNPSLSAEIPAVIEWAGEACGQQRVLLLDIGGDDVGATAIGRFADTLARYPYHFAYVVNKYRNLTQTPADALEVLREVEFKSHLKATAIVNNSHLRDETTADTVCAAIAFGHACAQEAGLPLEATTVPLSCVEGFAAAQGLSSWANAEGAASAADSDAVCSLQNTAPRVCEKAFVPFAAAPEFATSEIGQNYYIVRKFVRTPWE